MVRQIKKNFNVRLMGRINFEIPAALLELAYLAGLDLLDIPRVVTGDAGGNNSRVRFTKNATEIFPRWSIVSSLAIGAMSADEVRRATDSLLASGVIPLPAVAGGSAGLRAEETAAVFEYVNRAWHRYDVAIRPLLPLVRLVAPLESSETAGFIRTVFNRIQDRHLLATSDIRRHLRTSGAEASFESAGL